jgi:photosystem II stability/assembly factor-like uncharacterized protein
MSHFDHDPLTERLRDTFARHAAQAPNADPLAERIVRAATTSAPSPSPSPERQRGWRTWRTWALPLAAAGAVGAVVAAVVGIESYHPHAAAPAGSPSTGRPAASSTASTATASVVPAPPAVATSSAAPRVALRDVRVLDLTFVSSDEGWALGSADCLHGSGRCTALLHTTDGQTWHSMPGAAFNVAGVQNCADPCVDHLRFANGSVGYAYGPTALLMTTDGGLSWQRQPGGAVFLESLDGNVIRVLAPHTGCPAECFEGVQTAPIGSSHWTPAVLVPTPSGSGSGGGFGMSFARGGGGDAYLLMLGHAAGGGSTATSTLYRSTDRGQHWTSVGEPCPQQGGEVDSSLVAGAPDGRVSVLCTVRQSPHRSFVATSTDAGLHFTAQAGALPTSVLMSGSAPALSGDPTTVLLIAGDGIAISRDGAASWTVPPQPRGSVTFAGFESASVGRVVTDQQTLWTTRDAGRTWTAATIGD